MKSLQKFSRGSVTEGQSSYRIDDVSIDSMDMVWLACTSSMAKDKYSASHSLRKVYSLIDVSIYWWKCPKSWSKLPISPVNFAYLITFSMKSPIFANTNLISLRVGCIINIYPILKILINLKEQELAFGILKLNKTTTPRV